MRVTDSSQDARIQLCVAQARGAAEMKTRQQCLHSTWKLILDGFPGGVLLLPHVPLVNVVQMAYLDFDGEEQVVSATDYVVNVAPFPGVVVPRFGVSWPVALPQQGAVSVTYNAGYASPITANSTTNAITVNGPVAWAVNDAVRFSNSGGALPAPLQAGTMYKIATVSSNNTYTLKDVDNNLIDLTTSGTGTSFIGVVPPGLRGWMLIRAASLYENREEVAVLMRGSVAELPFMDGLLDEFRTSLP
jgi:hypothetical protein